MPDEPFNPIEQQIWALLRKLETQGKSFRRKVLQPTGKVSRLSGMFLPASKSPFERNAFEVSGLFGETPQMTRHIQDAGEEIIPLAKVLRGMEGGDVFFDPMMTPFSARDKKDQEAIRKRMRRLENINYKLEDRRDAARRGRQEFRTVRELREGIPADADTDKAIRILTERLEKIHSGQDQAHAVYRDLPDRFQQNRARTFGQALGTDFTELMKEGRRSGTFHGVAGRSPLLTLLLPLLATAGLTAGAGALATEAA